MSNDTNRTNVQLLERRIKRNSNEILSDNFDCKLYKRILKSRIGRAINRKEAFTMTFNTKGKGLSDSSSLSIWPYFSLIIFSVFYTFYFKKS
jgi:hypothetical protein